MNIIVDIMKRCMATFHIFQSLTHEQAKGTWIGSHILGYIVEIIFKKIKLTPFETLQPAFWVSNVDVAFAIIKRRTPTDFEIGARGSYKDS